MVLTITPARRVPAAAVCLAGLLMAASWVQAAGPPTVEVTCRHKKDRAIVVSAADGVTITIESHQGFGHAVVKRTGSRWPAPLALRLKLRGLEQLAISAAKIQLRVSVASHSGFPRRLELWRGGKKRSIETGSPYWIDVKALDAAGRRLKGLPGPGGGFELTLPPALLEQDLDRLTLFWIDFWR